ncbi:MAG: C40 family peptidase [Deltaproteobacteria bacterium]|nr:C40 family peptidase [Deltaproteobacteria bacterium]MBK8715889.1 C40 family peptidase [Deltaproteobacteria bacterium]MBP7286621.1 C40 family peptidase [Nannocystaceae bacterium]
MTRSDVASPREVDAIVTATVRLIEGCRRRLEQLHGATLLELRIAAQPRRRRLRLGGRVLVRRALSVVVDDIVAMLPAPWCCDATAVRVAAPRRWQALGPGVTRVYAAHPGLTGRWALATELVPNDGAVGILLERQGWTCIRALDATVGWIDARLGPRCPAPSLPRPTTTDARVMPAVARTWCSVPYRLGGRTRAGIDCSALVQRVALDALGVVLPRHSRDQLGLGCRPQVGPEAPGTLVFVWGANEPCGHVGIRTEAGTVVHASTSRGQVVEDSLTRFLRDASDVAHVPFSAMLPASAATDAIAQRDG